MPKISVIVPIYNVEPYLHRCVDSILAQTYQDFEIILIDDGSPDGCPQICDEYAAQDKCIHVIHQENGGLSAARNAGIDWAFANSDSEWITFIDSDDWVYPQYLEYLYRAVTENNVEISACGTVYEKNDTHTMKPQCYSAKRMTAEKYWIDNNGEVSVAWEKLYKKQLFELIRFPVGMIYEDEFTTYKLLFAVTQIAVLENNLYIYYYSESSILRSSWNEKKFANIDAVLGQLEFFRENGYKVLEKNTRRRLAFVINIDFKFINKEPDRYKQFEKIIDNKLKISYQKQYPQLSYFDYFSGRGLRKWIMWSNTMSIYISGALRKIKRLRVLGGLVNF